MNFPVSAKLIAITQPLIGVPAASAEELIGYCARVSSGLPKEDRGKDAEGLLKYCIRNKHWSIFEMANAVVEVEAPRDISRQLLRHRSFSFQEFSQRYSDDIKFCEREIRSQDPKNRQNSVDDRSEKEKVVFKENMSYWSENIYSDYKWYLDKGVAKECARVMLPEGLTMSSMYVNGTIRSWLHYLEVREGNGTQLEHIALANEIHKALEPALPTIFGAFYNNG